MDDFEAREADFAAPFFKIGGRIIERVAEFDLANLPGATSDECIEKKIDSLRFIESRIRRGECEPARKKCAECEANHLDGARLVPVSSYQ
jgi:hypothetical protein